jgi:oleate hydratase
LQTWLKAHGVRLVTDCTVTDLDHKDAEGKFIVTGIHCLRDGRRETITVNDVDFVFVQNGSMTDASSIGSMTSPPAQLTKADSGGWTLREKLAEGRPQFGNPAAFNSCIAQSWWESFTVTLKNPAFFDEMIRFSGNQPGTGGLVTFKDSNWLRPLCWPGNLIFRTSPSMCRCSGDTRCFRTGLAISSRSRWPSAMARKSCGSFAVTCDSIPRPSHRPTASLAECLRSPVCSCRAAAKIDRCLCHQARRISRSSVSLSKFDDVVFTVEYSVRAAQMAVYELLGIERKIPPVTPHAKSLHVQFEALIKALE